MKNVAANMKTHLREEVTTLALCVIIRRRDGVTYRLTTFDEPLIYDEKTYTPYHSMTWTSIQTTLELDVDSSEFQAIMNSAAVNREDISAGLFDYAEVEMFLVNYEHPEYGPVRLRKGWAGEVVSREDGTYQAEVRGLTQVLATRLGAAYAPECRADLGDRRCKVPLAPPEWQPRTIYQGGDIVLGHVQVTGGFTELMVDSFESGLGGSVAGIAGPVPAGWTGYGHAATAWGTASSFGGMPSSQVKKGSSFAYITGQASNGGGIYKIVDLIAAGADAGEIDQGLCRLNLEIWWGRVQQGQVNLRADVMALDANYAEAGTFWSSGWQQPGEDIMTQVLQKDILIPAGTRWLRFDLVSTKKVGDEGGGVFDYIKAEFLDPTSTYGGQEEYGGVAFQAANAGTSGDDEPPFNSTLGAETEDNDIVWVTIEAPLGEVITIDGVADDKGKVLEVVYIGQDDGYYDQGLIRFETGKNAGKSFEIKTYREDKITLYLSPPYKPEEGDRAVIYPGCDKRVQTCLDKFDNVVNFRGEPHVPGQDEYYKTPDANVEG